MKLKEAIGVSQAYYDRYYKHMTSKERDAIKLGIEALKRVQDQRNPDGWLGPLELPGETD